MFWWRDHLCQNENMFQLGLYFPPSAAFPTSGSLHATRKHPTTISIVLSLRLLHLASRHHLCEKREGCEFSGFSEKGNGRRCPVDSHVGFSISASFLRFLRVLRRCEHEQRERDNRSSWGCVRARVQRRWQQKVSRRWLAPSGSCFLPLSSHSSSLSHLVIVGLEDRTPRTPIQLREVEFVRVWGFRRLVRVFPATSVSSGEFSVFPAGNPLRTSMHLVLPCISTLFLVETPKLVLWKLPPPAATIEPPTTAFDRPPPPPVRPTVQDLGSLSCLKS